MIPAMVERGHDKAYATALVVSAGVLAPLIPPSIAFVIWGVIAEQSITKLFLSGVVPGAMMALACDMRYGTEATKTAFLFTRVGLAGADMGACALLPRMIGQGRASELLLTGRTMTAQEGHAWGFFNALHDSADLLPAAQKLAASLAQGPTFAHGMTKTMLHQEWAMTLDQAIEAEAQAQAICMQTQDFRRAYEAFAARRRPVFEGD